MDDDYWLIECGTAEEARGDYDHDVQRQRELDEMKTYEVQWVRVEHQVWTFEIEAEDEEDAAEKAREFSLSSKFNDMAEDYEVVYADEFANDIEEIEE